MLTIGLYGIKDTTHGRRPTHTHDHGVAFLRAGRVVDVVSLERLTRVKHDNRLDAHIGSILRDRVGDEPVRFVSVNSFVGDGFQSADGTLRVEPEGRVEISAAPTPARVRWWPDGSRPREAAGWALCHELAHVASLLPFVGRFEPRSLLVHIDGGASASACSAWSWDGQHVELVESSWDRLKEPVENFNVGPIGRLALGLSSDDHLAMPGQLMGYAGHGEPDRGLQAWLAERHFFLGRPDDEVRAALHARFGADPPYPALVATLQMDFEERVSRAIAAWQAKTGAQHLYYAGGAALNIPTNAALEASGRFRSVHVPPCTSDTGLALGAAAWLEFLDRGAVERHGPFLAQADNGPTSLDAVDQIASRLAAGEILGLCNGPAEVGPRALGHRSIVARPDSVALRRRVSEGLKRREPYRPVAPVLLPEVAREAFGPAVAESHLAPFMLGAWALRPGWAERFAGVVHADGTLRAQVVGDDPFLVALLRRLWGRHGVAGLLNTSFNGPGEPLVHTRADAIACGRRLPLDGVVIDGSLHRR
ncbi:MAG: hypothetical protein IT376_15990 [Polyangiaceae bacterium]|nr:hypothetical protein [Polyangiaceae bacterium]